MLTRLLPWTALAVLALPSMTRRAQEVRVPADDLPPVLPSESPLGLPERSHVEGDALVELGRRLFFEPRLSRNATVACASCHDPARAFADGTPLSVGVHGEPTRRNAPTLLNRAFGEAFMWDGSAASLEEQVLMPLENPIEMDLPVEEALARLATEPAWTEAFEAAGVAVDREGLAAGLAAFVRRLTLGDSPVDRFRAGERSALDAEERAGLWFYESRGRCWRCHSGANFSDEAFHNTGVGVRDGRPEEGRFEVTGDEADRGRFKTPTLRGVALTAPYMHDGSLATLEDVVAFYRQGGVHNAGLDEAMAPIEMTDQDAVNLVAFLEALSRRADGPREASVERR